MKLSRIATLLAGAGILAGAQVALAGNGAINFTGEIQDSTCEVDLANPFGQTVALLPVNKNAFAAVGDTAGWQEFKILLKNCGTAHTTARAFFESGATVNSVGRLHNTDELNTVAGAATGVDLQLRQAVSGQAIQAGNGAQQLALPGFTIDTTLGTAELRYEAGYYARVATVTPGTVKSSVTYSITYQ